jgi:hypothetical protein
MKNLVFFTQLVIILTSYNASAGFQISAAPVKGAKPPGLLKLNLNNSDSPQKTKPKLSLELSSPKSPTAPQKKDWVVEKNTQKDRIWVDLDKSSQYSLHPQHHDIAQAIDEYHCIPKQNVNLGTERINQLNAIISLATERLNRNSQDFESRTKLEFIRQTATNKKDYIEALNQVNDHNSEIVQSKHVGSIQTVTLHKGFISDGTQVMTKNNGEQLEHLDPAMRDGKILLPKYQEWIKNGGSPQDKQKFYYSLEEAEFGKGDLASDRIKSEDKKGTSSSQVIFENGTAKSVPHYSKPRQLYNEEEKYDTLRDPVLLPSVSSDETKPLHYVIDAAGHLYVNPNAVNHSDILNGRNVLSAGMITFENGKIKKINNDSGHYKPSADNLSKAVEVLRAKYGNEIFHESLEVNPVKVLEQKK